MRYTEYHAGKAVIKDKNKLAEAMEKLAEFEEKEKCGEWIDAIELAKIAIALQSQKWIPCSERLPKNEEYVLVSFENEGVTIPDIATYEVDKQGNGAFYPSDCNATYASCGVLVNAWMPLPKPYKEKKMGIKEAMEILEKDIHTDVPKAAIGARKHDAAVRMALVALKKQVPVKPIILDTLNGDIDYEYPMCGKQIMSDAESRNNFCGECGCKFDWSDIDE